MSEHDEPAERRATVRAVALQVGLVALMSLGFVGIYLRHTLGGVITMIILSGLLVVLIVLIAVNHVVHPILVRAVTIGIALLVTVVIAVPLLQRQAELNGSGIVWQADPAIGDGLQPYAVVGDAVVLQDGARLVFLDLADGHLRGTVPKRSDAARLSVAGDRLLVATGEQYQLYDDSARPLWPESIIADADLAAAGDVVVLQRHCGAYAECAFGFDLEGKEVWQREVAAYLPFSESIRLPERIVSQDRADDGEWTILNAGDGRSEGVIKGDYAFATGPDVNAFTMNENRCTVHGQDRPPGEPFSCGDRLTMRWLDEQLLAVEGAEGGATIVRLDRSGGQLTEADSSTAYGHRSRVQVGRLGWARLSDRVLEFGDWPSGFRDADRHTDPLPIEPEGDMDRASVTVEGSTVLVTGSARPTHTVDTREQLLFVFDFAGGQTARLRLPDSAGLLSRDDILSTGPGQALIRLHDRPPMLIGRPS